MKTRIWNLTETFPGKVNFIDSNNVILGYELGQYCSERLAHPWAQLKRL